MFWVCTASDWMLLLLLLLMWVDGAWNERPSSILTYSLVTGVDFCSAKTECMWRWCRDDVTVEWEVTISRCRMLFIKVLHSVSTWVDSVPRFGLFCTLRCAPPFVRNGTHEFWKTAALVPSLVACAGLLTGKLGKFREFQSVWRKDQGKVMELWSFAQI